MEFYRCPLNVWSTFCSVLVFFKYFDSSRLKLKSRGNNQSKRPDLIIKKDLSLFIFNLKSKDIQRGEQTLSLRKTLLTKFDLINISKYDKL